MGEVSNLTPQNVRLISLKFREVNATPQGAPQATADKTSNENTDDVVMEGIIFDKKDMLESDLTQYIIKLENSLIFNKVSVQKKNVVNFNKKEVIHFVLSAKIG
jgi:hypothetical protein